MPSLCPDRAVRKDVAATFFGLLRGSHEFQEGVLHRISAFDAAKLDVCFNGFLFCSRGPVAGSKREYYLSPIRDLFWDAAGVEALLQEGLRLVLLGPDVHALEQRLLDTERYIETSSSRRRLRIYLVGTFPIRGKSASTLDGMIGFSVDGTPTGARILNDRWQLRRVQQSMLLTPGAERAFIMAFGAPKDVTAQQKSFWYRAADPRDSTVDLRVYVPSFSDRERERVCVSFRTGARLLGLSPGRPRFHIALNGLLRLCGGGRLLQTAQLTDAGIKLVDRAAERGVALRARWLLPSLRLAR